MRLGRWIALAALVTIAAGMPPTNASPAGVDTVIAASAQPSGFDYVVEEVVVDVAGLLTFINADLREHDVVAVADHPTGDAPWCDQFPNRNCPLFASALVELGESTTVEGIDQLTPLASYEFYCSKHPGMTGTLHTI